MLTLLTTWKTGRSLIADRIRVSRTPLATFVDGVGRSRPGDVVRVPGTAVFLYSQRSTTPPGLAALLRSTNAMHEWVYVVAIVTDDVPRVHPIRRLEETDLGHGVHQVILHYGFMEPTPVAADLDRHLHLSVSSTDYFLGRESVRSTERPGMARWREALFRLMSRNATDVATYFQLPAERVIEIGVRVDI